MASQIVSSQSCSDARNGASASGFVVRFARRCLTLRLCEACGRVDALMRAVSEVQQEAGNEGDPDLLEIDACLRRGREQLERANRIASQRRDALR
jgi:hypothetical protein